MDVGKITGDPAYMDVGKITGDPAYMDVGKITGDPAYMDVGKITGDPAYMDVGKIVNKDPTYMDVGKITNKDPTYIDASQLQGIPRSDDPSYMQVTRPHDPAYMSLGTISNTLGDASSTLPHDTGYLRPSELHTHVLGVAGSNAPAAQRGSDGEYIDVKTPRPSEMSLATTKF